MAAAAKCFTCVTVTPATKAAGVILMYANDAIASATDCRSETSNEASKT